MRPKKKIDRRRGASSANDDELDERYSRILSMRACNLISRIQDRCQKNKTPFDLNKYMDQIQERIERGKCEVTGIKFGLPGRWLNGNAMSRAKCRWNSPSVDRIDPEGGYVYSNIRIVCFAFNAARNCWGDDILWKVVESWCAMRGGYANS